MTLASLFVLGPAILAVSTLALNVSAAPWNHAPVGDIVDFTAADLATAIAEGPAIATPTVELIAEVAGIAVSTETPAVPAIVEPTMASVTQTPAPAVSPTLQATALAPVLVATQPPAISAIAPSPVTTMALPQGYSVHVSTTGCLPNGVCPFGGVPANFYWAPTRTAVVYTAQPSWVIQHEGCHAHQQLTIQQELGVEPAMPYDLHEWLSTLEARTWSAMVTTAWPASGQWAVEPGAHTAIEDFGISCGLYLTNPAQLKQTDPARYAAVDAILR